MVKNRTSRRDPALSGYCKCSNEIGSKLEAWRTGSEFVLCLEPQASCLKRISALADGLMLVFHHPADPNFCCPFFSAGTLSRTLCHRESASPHAISRLTKALNID
jgi:hypothetical protein